MDDLIEKIKAKRIELRDAGEAKVAAETAQMAARQRVGQLEREYEDLMTEFHKATEPPFVAKLTTAAEDESTT